MNTVKLSIAVAALVLSLSLVGPARAGETNTGPGAAPTPTPVGRSYTEPVVEEPTEDTSLLVTLTQLVLMLL